MHLPSSSWRKKGFNISVGCTKSDSVDNNMAEICNEFIMDARYRSIVSILKSIFQSVRKRIVAKKTWATSIEQPIAPRIIKN